MKIQKYAPIIVSVYDRLEHLQHCISSLLANKEASLSVLYVVSDAAYKQEDAEQVNRVREYVRGISGFYKVNFLFRDKNLGAHQSIILAIHEVLKTNETFIFLEDDIVVSENFLQYMNEGLSYYRNEKRIFSICGFCLPFRMPLDYTEDVYFYPCSSPWGFACWKDRWEQVNHAYYNRYAELKKNRFKYKQFVSIGFFIKGILRADSNKEIEASDLRIYYHMCQNNLYSVFPVVSKTQNWGFDGSGEHCNNKNAWWVKPLLDKKSVIQFFPFKGCDKKVLINVRRFNDKINGGFLAKYLKYTWIYYIYRNLKSKWL